MDQEKKPFIHDTINLDEIRLLLGDALGPAADMDLDFGVKPAADETEVEAVEPEVVEEEPQAMEQIAEEPVEEVPDAEEVVSAEDNVQDEDPLLMAETMVISLDDLEDDDALDVPAFMLEDEEPSEPMNVLPPEEASAEHPADEETAEESDEEQKHTKNSRRKNSAANEFYYLLHDVVYLLAAVTLVFVFFVRLVGVKGDSMFPTLWNQDFLVLESNFLIGSDDLRYGDIVVLNAPYYDAKEEGPIVKRVIATEGQTVSIDFESGAVYVDGVMLSETYINELTQYNWEGDLGLQYPAVVPENCIFVLGDNRNNSMDSRFAPIGMIDERCVLGKVLLIALPGQTVDDAGNVIMPRDWGRIGLVS